MLRAVFRVIAHSVRAIVLVVFLTAVSGPAIADNPPDYFPPPTEWDMPAGAPAAPGDAYKVSFGTATPAATAPVISEWNRTAKPNESFTLTGARFTRKTGTDAGSDTTVWLYAWNGSTGVMRQCKIWKTYGDYLVMACVPSDVPFGQYLVWVENQDGISAPVCINKTQAEWIGPLGPYGSAGSTKRVFGKNLSTGHGTTTSYVYIQPSSGGSFISCSVTNVEPGAVTFTIPDYVEAGSYNVFVHSGHGERYGWSGALALTVAADWLRGTAIVNVSPSGGDDSSAIQSAIDTVTGLPNGGTVQLAGGTYKVSANLIIKNNVAIVGAGHASTTLFHTAGSFGLDPGAGHVLVQNLAIQTGSGVAMNVYSRSVSGGAYNTDIAFKNVDLNVGSDTTSSIMTYFMVDRLEMSNCTCYANISGDGRDWWLHDNTLHGGRPCPEAAISLSQGNGTPHGQYVIENNTASTPNWPAGPSNDYFYKGWSGSTGFLTQAQWQQLVWCPRLINLGVHADSYENGYISHNTTTNTAILDNKGEVILLHMSEANLYCQVASNVGTTLTIRTDGSIYGNSSFSVTNAGAQTVFPIISVPTNMVNGQVDNKAYVVVVNGTGIGQCRKIVSHTTNTITVDSDWRVQPASDSIIVIDYLYRNHTVYQNSLSGFPSGFVTHGYQTASCEVDFAGNCFGCIAEGNVGYRLQGGDSLGSCVLAPSYWNEARGDECRSSFGGGHNFRASVGCAWYAAYSAVVGPIVLGNFYRGGVSEGVVTTQNVSDMVTSNFRSLIGNAVEGMTISSTSSNAMYSGDQDDTLYRNNTVTLTGTGNSVTLQNNSQPMLDGNTYTGGTNRYYWLGAPVIKINAGDTGDGSISGYLIDQDYSGGSKGTDSNSVDLSVDPLPSVWIAKYYRYGPSFSYTIPCPLANTSYKVRLHFLEPTHTSAGQRTFNVTGNGSTLVSNYDVWAEVGKDKAVYHDYNVTSNSSGQIVLQFTGVISTALVCAIEVSSYWADSPAPLLRVAQFTGVVGLPVSPVSINVGNLGVGSWAWGVTSGTPSWVTASVASGGTLIPETESGVLNVGVNTSGRPAGTSWGKVNLTTANGKTFVVGVEVRLSAPTSVNTLSQLAGLSSGTAVSITSPKVVTSASGTFSDGSCYIEDSDRSRGIKVTGAMLALSENVTVTGTVAADANGERLLRIASVDSRVPGDVMGALGMLNMTTSASGLLVTVWGRVVSKNASSFVIDDGSKRPVMIDVSGRSNPIVVLPSVGAYVGVTGLAGYATGGTLAVKPRSGTDIQIY